MTAAAKLKTAREALIDVMDEVGAVGKERRIEQGPAKYAYRSIEDMLSKIQPAFVRHGVVCVPRVLGSEYRDGTTRNGGSTREATLTVQFDFYGPDGSVLSAVTIGEATDTSDKASNKAMTAAFKYALLMVLAIPTDEHDQDAERIERGPQQPTRPAADPRVVEGKKRMLELVSGDKTLAGKLWNLHVGDAEPTAEVVELALEKAAADVAPFDGGDAA